jgi:anti-sigma factor RsiW
MKERNELDREIIHRLLDGDLGPDEKKALADRVKAEPVLNEEFDDLLRVVRAVETSERIPAPPFFTAAVMRQLKPKEATLGIRIRDFVLKGRVLRWNMATAFAAMLVFALVLTFAVRTRNAPEETAMIGQQEQEQTVTVTMNLQAPEAHHVAVAGTFNKWKTDTHVLTRQENGIWTISVPLKPGEHSYMFVVDGKAWVTDPNADAYRDDGFGNKNAVKRVSI